MKIKAKVIISGAAGRMGRQLISCAMSDNEVKLTGALEMKDHPLLGSDAGAIAGCGNAGTPLGHDLDKMLFSESVLIDFSQPSATLKNLQIAEKSGSKVVIGTTGLASKDLAQIKKIARKIAIVYSPNMSIGMNLLFKLTKESALALGKSYNVEIIEAHHKLKKDAPSGSAKKLAEMAAAGLKIDLGKHGVYGREGFVGERTKDEIGIHAVRAGDIVGDHTVLFGGLGERIELRHVAGSRETFARGAIRAAKWLSDKTPGIYSMQDVLDL